jgi:hypothetical protein
MICTCSAQTACAAQSEPGISAALFQRVLQLVGLSVTIQPGPNDDFPVLVTVQGIGKNAVSLGFPAGGLTKNSPFYLASDDAAALVQVGSDGALTVIDGDERITASGILGFIACLLTTIAYMIVDILTAVLSLNIVGILTAVFGGLVSILNCLLNILV